MGASRFIWGIFLLLLLLGATPSFGEDQDSVHKISIRLYNLDFKQLVLFEADLEENVPYIVEVSRKTYHDDTAEISIGATLSAEDLAEWLISNEFTDFQFTVVEFTEDSIALSFGGDSAVPRKEFYVDPNDNRIRIGMVEFDDPFGTGLGNRAEGDIGAFFRRMSYVNYQPKGIYGPMDRGILGMAQDYMSGGAKIIDPGAMGLDWIIRVKVDDFDTEFFYTAPLIDYDTGRIEVEESWQKYTSLEVGIEIVDLIHDEVIYDESVTRRTSDWGSYRWSMRSDRAMMNDMWDSAANWFYIDILDFMFSRVHHSGWVVARMDDKSDRAIVNVGSVDGIYRELPMRLYVPDLEGNTSEGWQELCKVTVKEVYSDFSVIELPGKWFQYFEFGEGNNIVWPMHPSTD